MLETIERRWSGLHCIIAATGPSLNQNVADLCHAAHQAGTHKIIAVNDAYRLLPFSDVLYACDATWWEVHKGCPGFLGEKWSSHGCKPHPITAADNDKTEVGKRYGLKLIQGKEADGFSLDQSIIHYGRSSGFQAINLAILFGSTWNGLVGFDMHSRRGRHFFGDHPRPLLNSSSFESWVPYFRKAAAKLPSHIKIVNCTSGSALDCFPMADLASELAADLAHA